MGWRHPAARHRQQRWGYSGRTSERSHHVVLIVWSCNIRGAGRRKTGFAAVSIDFEASQPVYAVLRAFGGRAAAAPVVLPLAMVAFASQSADDMAPIRVAGFGYTQQAMSRWTNSPN